MSIIIGTPESPPFPSDFAPAICEIKQKFSDDWTYDPSFEVVTFSAHAGSSQCATAELRYRYGSVKLPHEADFSTRPAQDLIGYWVRLSLAGPTGPSVQFVGQIEGNSTTLYGTAAPAGSPSAASGIQNFSAAGGLRILEKITMDQAWMLETGFDTPVRIGWVPGMNKTDKRGLLVGNKTDTSDQLYYGGKTPWSHLDYANYVLKNFVQQPGGDAPAWTITGQAYILATMQTTIEFGASMTIVDVLRKLIPVEYGLDFSVVATEGGQGGYQINVFALTSTTQQVNGVSLPSNPLTLSFRKDQQIDLVDAQIVTTTQRRYDALRVVGKRIVVCGSLWGTRAAVGATAVLGKTQNATFLPKWGAAIEADYISAGGLVTSQPDARSTAYDRVRKRDKYREVYQHFGAPSGWDKDGGAWSVYCNPDGSLSSNAGLQHTIRETLSWIPLREGFDYFQDPPTDNTLGDNTTEPVRPPLCWIFDELPDDDSSPHYVQAELIGIHTHHPYQDWGLILNGSPNHIVAKNHLSPEQVATMDIDDETELRYDYATAVATIAIESDWRLNLAFTVPANLAAGDGSVMTIVDEEAECWVLLPNTIVDVDNKWSAVAPNVTSGTPYLDTTQLLASGPKLRTLRNDSARLALILAGVVSKYTNERARAQLTFNGFNPWSGLIGTILTTYEQGDLVRQVGAPITSVIWTSEPIPTTVVKTGYA